MTCGPLIIGAGCGDQIDHGETIDLALTYQNEDGTPIDLTDAQVEVLSSDPDIIRTAAVVTVEDAAAGLVRVLLRRDDAAQLRLGPRNSFRMRAIFGPDSDDVTPDIYLQVT
ncbi:hypothetical protein ACLBXM_04940 [Xanthobacteraceae bacterium A53D]